MKIKHCMIASALLLSLTTSVSARTLIADRELEKIRAGYFNLNGIELGLGATMKTYIDGQLALVTTASWTENGTTVVQQIPMPDAQAMASNIITNLGITGPSSTSNTQTATVQNTSTNANTAGAGQNAIATLNVPDQNNGSPLSQGNTTQNRQPLVINVLADPNSGKSGQSGVVVPGDGGATTIVHNLTTNQISNVLINTASDRNIVQQTNVDIAIPNLSDLAQGMAAIRVSQGLQSASDMAATTMH